MEYIVPDIEKGVFRQEGCHWLRKTSELKIIQQIKIYIAYGHIILNSINICQTTAMVRAQYIIDKCYVMGIHSIKIILAFNCCISDHTMNPKDCVRVWLRP